MWKIGNNRLTIRTKMVCSEGDPEDDQSVETNGSFQNLPNSFRDYHYAMVLPKTFLYRVATMQSFKSYLSILFNNTQNPDF